MPLLVVERGNDKGLTLRVEPAKSYVVGRDNPQAAVKLRDPMASRAHFVVTSLNGAWRVRDMKSRNGTLLNDEKLPPETEKDLRIGDKIQVGETIFSFLSDEKEEVPGGLIGKTIGGYTLLERIGRGGMGTVYKAEQMSLKRVVALKVLSSKLLSDPVFVERFVQEARAAGGLNHPNIVQVFDVGSDRGVYYFSMELMEHGSVGDIVSKEGAVPWERALEMLTDASKGLIFAEKKGIIHRDIKPDNLMLTAEGTVKIGDLGLAKRAEEAAGEGGQIFGTPHFIAPEQAQGKPIDHRADTYALGASFYRILSGKTPFTGENVKEILVKQVQEEPVPLQKLATDLPDELAAVIGKMMKKRPDDRYRSAQGLYEDLELIRVRYHLEAHGQAASARRTKLLAVVLGLAVLGLGGVVYHFATKEPPEPEIREVIRDNPNQRNNTNTGPAITPEEKALMAFLPVDSAESKLFGLLKGGPGETWRANEPKWIDIAEKFEKVAADHPNTPKGDEAMARAKGIRGAIDRAKAAWNARSEKANADWRTVVGDADRLAEEGMYAAAVARLLDGTNDLVKKNAEFLPPDAAKTVQEQLAGFVRAAEEKAGPLMKAAEEAAPIFPGERYHAARKALEAMKGGLLPASGAADPSSKRLREISALVGRTLGETQFEARAAAAAALAHDRDAYFRGYLAIRRFSPVEDPAAPPAASPFFDYRWDDAIARWEALLQEMRTKPFRDRVEAKIAQYRRCRRLFVTIAAKVRSREIRDPDFPDFVKKGASVSLDARQAFLDRATPEGVPVIRGAARQTDFVEFRAMTPRELYEDFLRAEELRKKQPSESLPFSGEEHMDLAVFLAEAGCGDFAWLELSAATTGANASTADKALLAWVNDESILYYEIHDRQEGPVGLLDAYRRRKEEGARPAELDALRRVIEEKIRALEEREGFYRTDYFILVRHSLWTQDDPVPERLFPAAVTDGVLRTLGVEGGPVLPDEDEAPPPPPGDGGNGDAGTTPGDGDGDGKESTEKPK